MQKDLTLESLDKSLEQSKKQELEKQQQIELESMNAFQKSLKTLLKVELSSITDDILEMQKSINQNNKTLATNSKQYSEEVAQSLQEASQQLTKIKTKQWIIPTIIGLAIVLALALGTWGTTKYLTHQLLALVEVKEAQKAIKSYSPVLKVWRNGIEIKKGYQVKLEKTEDGTYFLRVEE